MTENDKTGKKVVGQDCIKRKKHVLMVTDNQIKGSSENSFHLSKIIPKTQWVSNFN